MNGKTEIYRLSYSVRIFKCFKWDVFNTIFSTKNETMLELFNFYDTLCPKYLTKMYLNQYKQNKNDCVNNNNGYNSKNSKNGDGNKIITIKITTTIKVIIINSLHVFQSGEFPAASTTTFYATMLYSNCQMKILPFLKFIAVLSMNTVFPQMSAALLGIHIEISAPL